MKPGLECAWFQRLKLKPDTQLSIYAFNFNLRPYIMALACIDEGVPFINGSPQNTFVPGVIEASVRLKSLIGGDDFKSGQTKMKSVLVDFLVGAGIKQGLTLVA